MSAKRSRVHPPYKTKYRVANWSEYDRALANRGSLTAWTSPRAIKSWRAKPTGKRGGQQKFSDLAIETAMTLRLLLHLPFRQIEGFLGSLFELMDLDLEAPDPTTLSRRAARLKTILTRRPSSGPIVLAIDSSGLTVVGQGQWAAARYGKRVLRGCRKIHLGVDESGLIVAQKLTDAGGDDARNGAALIRKARHPIDVLIGDRAYDTREFYSAANSRGADVVVPPIKTASSNNRQPPGRKRAIDRIKQVGRKRWAKEAGYNRQARVENAFFRFKTIIGDRLRATRER